LVLATAKWRIIIETKGAPPNIKEALNRTLNIVSEIARQEWVRVARQRLHRTAETYVQGISDISGRGSKRIIKLIGWLPNALEEGTGPYDLKRGLLRSPKARRDAQGRPYIAVPFTHATPMAKINPMPAPIYRLAKSLETGGPGLQLPKRLEGWGLRSRLSPNKRKWGPYTWKFSPYEGMIKTRGLPEAHKMQRSAYMTFRTVSTKSDPDSWIHPGFRPLKAMEEAQERMHSRFLNVDVGA
jgi:hypothetical protein